MFIINLIGAILFLASSVIGVGAVVVAISKFGLLRVMFYPWTLPKREKWDEVAVYMLVYLASLFLGIIGALLGAGKVLNLLL